MKKFILFFLLTTNCFSSEWQRLPCNWRNASICIWVLNVPHGWLVATSTDFRAGIAFYPDENHSWKIGEVK